VSIIKNEYSGRYSINEYGGYVIEKDADTTIEIYFENYKVSYISVEQRNITYANFLDIANTIIEQQGEPKNTYMYEEDVYALYWWGKDLIQNDILFDYRLSVTLGDSYTVVEAVFYGA